MINRRKLTKYNRYTYKILLCVPVAVITLVCVLLTLPIYLAESGAKRLLGRNKGVQQSSIKQTEW